MKTKSQMQRNLEIGLSCCVMLAVSSLAAFAQTNTGSALKGQSPVKLEFRLVDDAKDSTKPLFTDRTTGQRLPLHEEVVLNASHIASAQVRKGDYGAQVGLPEVHLTLTEDGTKILMRLTTENIGRMLAILVNGEVVVAPMIRATVRNGKVVIQGKITNEEAVTIAAQIDKSGKGR